MLISLQILRGLAATVVVFHHIVQSYYSDVAKNAFWEIMARHGGFGVDIFFALSGYIMATSSGKYYGRGLSYWKGRLIRILPNYWFYSALLVASMAVFPPKTYVAAWTAKSLILSLLLVPNRWPNAVWSHPTLYVGWSLTYEIFFYTVLAIALLLKTRHYLNLCALTLCAVVLLAKVDFLGMGRADLLGFGYPPLLEFVGGILIYGLSTVRKAARNERILLLALLLVFGVALLSGEVKTLFKLLLAVGIVSAFLAAETICAKKNVATDLLRQLGDCSYSIYLSHVVVIGWFYGLFGNRATGIRELLILAGILVVTVLVSRLTFRHIETGAFPDFLKNLGRRRAARP